VSIFISRLKGSLTPRQRTSTQCRYTALPAGSCPCSKRATHAPSAYADSAKTASTCSSVSKRGEERLSVRSAVPLVVNSSPSSWTSDKQASDGSVLSIFFRFP
jgi:hypothetical protein